jgi:uncharacterized membrane protein YeaQ/YmgE (transglycosylase-associated protein family)
MTFEARVAFVIFLFAVWLFFGLMAWAAVAVIKRGRGALAALPLALAGAALGGVLVPLLGMQSGAGFALSLCTATAGGFAGAFVGIAFASRMGIAQPPIDEARRPERES